MPQEHFDRTRLALSWIGGVLLFFATLLLISYAWLDYNDGVINVSTHSYLRVQGPLVDSVLPVACVCMVLGVAALIYSRLHRTH
jgi:TRAP-type C4-dicarboxylate transport system permease small subunit